MSIDDLSAMSNLVNSIRVPQIQDMPHRYMWSDTQFEIIKKYVEEFEESLDEQHEVGVMLTNFGHSVLMQVQEIRYEKSVIMVFKGLVDGNPTILLQHINQLNFLLVKMKRDNPSKPKRKIGFTAGDDN